MHPHRRYRSPEGSGRSGKKFLCGETRSRRSRWKRFRKLRLFGQKSTKGNWAAKGRSQPGKRPDFYGKNLQKGAGGAFVAQPSSIGSDR
jgi:hypothetical protein